MVVRVRTVTLKVTVIDSDSDNDSARCTVTVVVLVLEAVPVTVTVAQAEAVPETAVKPHQTTKFSFRTKVSRSPFSTLENEKINKLLLLNSSMIIYFHSFSKVYLRSCLVSSQECFFLF